MASSRAAGIRRERQLHGVAALQRHRGRAVGCERHVQQVGDNLAPGRARLSRNLQHRVADDEGVLERFAVGSVFQIHVASAERLQRAGASLGFGNSRVAAQLDAVEVLLIVFQVGEAVVGLDHLTAAQRLDAAFEPQVLVAARHRRRGRGDVGGARRQSCIRGDEHVGLIEDDQHVLVLVVRHAHARPGEPFPRKLHRARHADRAVGFGIGRVLAADDQPVARRQGDVAVHRDRRLVLPDDRFLGGDGEGALAVALLADDLHALESRGAVLVGELLLVLDRDVLAGAIELHHAPGRAFDDRVRIGAARRPWRRHRDAAFDGKRHQHREPDREDGDEQTRPPLPPGHRDPEMQDCRSD